MNMNIHPGRLTTIRRDYDNEHEYSPWTSHNYTGLRGMLQGQIYFFYATVNYLLLPAALGPRIYSPLTEMSNRSRNIMFLGNRSRPVCRADNLNSICEPIV
jgi:hypothetical protein